MTNTSKILSYLEDEQSKFIFQKRVEFNETGDFNAIKAIVKRYLPQLWDKPYYPGMENELPKKLTDKHNIVIFGCGMNGKGIVRFLKSYGIMPECFLDNSKDKWGKRVEGLEVRCPYDIDIKATDAVVITPFNYETVDAMRKQLLEMGVEEDIMFNYKDYSATVLEDELYFDSSLIKLHENEVFVDAGALNLETSFRFIKECQKSHVRNYSVHAFEPDSLSYAKCKNMLSSISYSGIKLYNYGLWSEEKTLYFEETGNAASRISDTQTGTAVKVTALDVCVSDPITFIKMDIEGAELEALKGSSKIIKKYMPKLAISLYHKKDDILEIPLYIKELVPEYKLYIRHYSNTSVETVLYAV